MVWHNTKVIHICNIISVCGCVYFPRLVSLSVTFSTLCFHPGSWGVVSLWDRQRDKQSWTTPPLLFPPYPPPCKDMHSKNRKCVFHSAWNLPSPPPAFVICSPFYISSCVSASFHLCLVIIQIWGRRYLKTVGSLRSSSLVCHIRTPQTAWKKRFIRVHTIDL